MARRQPTEWLDGLRAVNPRAYRLAREPSPRLSETDWRGARQLADRGRRGGLRRASGRPRAGGCGRQGGLPARSRSSMGTAVRSGRKLAVRTPAGVMDTAWPPAMSSIWSSWASTRGLRVPGRRRVGGRYARRRSSQGGEAGGAVRRRCRQERRTSCRPFGGRDPLSGVSTPKGNFNGGSGQAAGRPAWPATELGLRPEADTWRALRRRTSSKKSGVYLGVSRETSCLWG